MEINEQLLSFPGLMRRAGALTAGADAAFMHFAYMAAESL